VDVTNSHKGDAGMRRKGFTLFEALVVIAIIAILAAILYSVFGRAHAKSLQAQCLAHEKELSVAFAMYEMDWDGVMPRVDSAPASILILPYAKEEALVCDEQPPNEEGKRPVSYLWNEFMLRGGAQGGAENPKSILLFGEGVNEYECFSKWEELEWPHSGYGNLCFLDGHVKAMQGLLNGVRMEVPASVRIAVTLPMPKEGSGSTEVKSDQIVEVEGKNYRVLIIGEKPELVPLE